MICTVAAIARYPVKGLSPDPMTSVILAPDQGLPGDRRYAIADGSEAADLLRPRWLPRDQFVTPSRCPRLSAITTTWDDTTTSLTILRDGRQVARANLSTALGRARVSDFFSAFLKGELRGTPLVMEAPGTMFSDSEDKRVTLISSSSLSDLARVVGRPVDPRRFRANIILDGLAPWQEFGWVGGFLHLGSACLHILGRIPRDEACSVDPVSGTRDVNIPLSLEKGFGHSDFGLYARVVEGGVVEVGNAVTLAPTL